ncbi:MAG: hypothetical protein OXH86_00620 [Acidimicrobiaceae bacterium]|nr:hypothetical protein [Acidimicrobiaceae bacterium]
MALARSSGVGQALRRRGHRAGRGEAALSERGRGERGETIAMLIVWPIAVVAILLMLVHAFIVTNAQAEADLAASHGLRSAWRHLSLHDIGTVPGPNPGDQPVDYMGPDPHPQMLAAAEAAQDAAARVAGSGEGWRWWTPGATLLRSDWCDEPQPTGTRPEENESGWLQVVVRGEVFGPLAAIFPGRLDEVYAVAQGPAVLAAYAEGGERSEVPAEFLAEC